MDTLLVKKKIRKYKDMLTCAGYGILILVLWSFVKTAAYLTWIIPTTIESIIDAHTISYFIINGVEILFCLVAGIVFLRYGKNDKKVNAVLLIISLIILLLATAGFLDSVSSIPFIKENYVITTINIVEDSIFLVFSFLILIAVIKLLKYYKMLLGAKR